MPRNNKKGTYLMPNANTNKPIDFDDLYEVREVLYTPMGTKVVNPAGQGKAPSQIVMLTGWDPANSNLLTARQILVIRGRDGAPDRASAIDHPLDSATVPEAFRRATVAANRQNALAAIARREAEIAALKASLEQEE